MNSKGFNEDTLKRMLKDVVKWNALGGNSVSDKSLINIYTTLAREEMFGQNEFLQGFFNNDKEMMADGTGDLIYTAGFLSQLTEDDTMPLSCADLEQTTLPEVIDLLSSDLILCPNTVYNSLLGLCIKMSEIMDVEEVFDAISTSNYSKYLHVSKVKGKEHLDNEILLIENKGRYWGVDYRLDGEYWIFTAKGDNESGVKFDKPKIVKHSMFEEPVDLTQFIY